MTQRERLDKFKTLYQPRVGYELLVSVTSEDKLLAVVYKKIEILNKRGLKDTASVSEAWIKESDMTILINKLTPYIINRDGIKAIN